MNISTECNSCKCSNGNCCCFSWKGVFVGALVAFGFLFLFNMFTIGGGLSVYTKTEQGLETLITIAYIWKLFGSFILLFIAGYITSVISCRANECTQGLLPGFIMWVLYVILSLVFLSHMTGVSIIASIPQSLGSPREMHAIGVSTLAAFFVLFVEALAACFGAWCGVEYLKRNKKV